MLIDLPAICSTIERSHDASFDRVAAVRRPGSADAGLRLVVPAHLRAVDASVLQEAGRNTPALIEQGLTLVQARTTWERPSCSCRRRKSEGLPDRQRLGLAITNLAMQHPRWLVWGGGDARLDRLFASDPHLPKSGSEPFTDFMVREDNRTVVLELLGPRRCRRSRSCCAAAR